MTQELCVGACRSRGYAVAGLEYGKECFCGVGVGATAAKVADLECEVMYCPGNLKEFCGAASRLAIYVRP